MSMKRPVVALAVVLALAAAPSGARAVEATFDLNVGGGTLMPWEHPDEIGNAYGGSVGVSLHQFRIALAAAGILPDSRIQGHFGLLAIEVHWRPFEPFYGLLPYVLGAVGLTVPDDVDDQPAMDPPPVRWARRVTFVGTLGLGLAYGAPTGFYLAVDARAYNISHGGLNISAGYRF